MKIENTLRNFKIKNSLRFLKIKNPLQNFKIKFLLQILGVKFQKCQKNIFKIIFNGFLKSHSSNISHKTPKLPSSQTFLSSLIVQYSNYPQDTQKCPI